MIDSAARAERFDPAPSLAPCYTWEVPQKPVLVRLPLLLIDRLEREAVETFRSVSSRGSEIGGVLWGVVDPGEPASVSVVEYELIPCDYALGPLYRLSDGDGARLEKAVAQTGSGLLPVGFFRSHTRKGLSLDADDLALMESRFREPYQVALVIRPFATKASTAGIFIRENGQIHSEASYQEFPFRSSQLAPTKHLADVVETAPNTAAPPAVPKPAVRAQIVPIASRRDISAVPPLAAEPAPLPPVQAAPPAPQPVIQPQPVAQAILQPVPQPVPAAQPAPEPVEQAAPALPVAPAPRETARESAPAEKPTLVEKAAPVEKPALVEKAGPVEKASAVEKPALVEKPSAPEPSEETFAAPATGVRSKLMWAAVAAILVLLGGVLFIYPGVFRHANTPSVIGGQDSSPLALRVEQSAGELLLTWNNDSGAIRNATHAVLSISDGEQHENVEMDMAQLRNGKIEYLPVTSDVVFKMEVSGKNNTKTASESVRVLRTRPSPMSSASDSPAATGATKPAASTAPNGAPGTTGAANSATPNLPNSPGAPNPPAGSPAADNAASNPPSATTPAQPTIPVRPFNTASLGARLRPVHTDDVALPDAPVVGGASVAASDAALKLTSVAPPPPPTVAKKADARVETPAAPSKQSATAGGEVEQAQLIYRKQPDYPPLARSAGAKGMVELVATIGTDGRVKKVKFLKGHPLLQKAAVDAVMQWQYRPTMLNGHPVETETTITLNFVSDR